MVEKDPAEVASTWASRLSAATSRIRDNVAKVTEAPSAKAVAKKEKMKANLIAAIDSGKWDGNLRKYTLSQWVADMQSKAVSRIPEGVNAAKADFQAFMNELLPYEKSGQAKIAGMPDLTLEDAVARASEWIRHMAKFSRKS